MRDRSCFVRGHTFLIKLPHDRTHMILADCGSQFYTNEGERKEKNASQFEAISQSERIARDLGAGAHGKNAVEVLKKPKRRTGPKKSTFSRHYLERRKA
jgi:hypothetical protein